MPTPAEPSGSKQTAPAEAAAAAAATVRAALGQLAEEDLLAAAEVIDMLPEAALALGEPGNGYPNDPEQLLAEDGEVENPALAPAGDDNMQVDDIDAGGVFTEAAADAMQAGVWDAAAEGSEDEAGGAAGGSVDDSGMEQGDQGEWGAPAGRSPWSSCEGEEDDATAAAVSGGDRLAPVHGCCSWLLFLPWLLQLWHHWG